jgi:hypothetical protein
MPSKGWSWNLNRPPASRCESERLAKLLHPFNARVRMMGVLDLETRIDESGTHASSDIVILAGMLAPAAAWTTLDQGWLTVLTDAGVPFYHATEVEARRPEREVFRRLTRRQRRQLTDDLTAVASGIDELCPFGVFVDAKDWFAATDLIKPYFKPDDFEALKIDPFELVYQMLVKTCISIVMEHINDSLPKDEKVAFIFEDNQWSPPALTGYQTLKSIHPKSCRFGAIAFEPKIAFPGLQAADLLAWSYRRSKRTHLGYHKGKPHRSFVRLVDREDRDFRHMSRAALEDELNKAMAVIASGKLSSSS